MYMGLKTLLKNVIYFLDMYIYNIYISSPRTQKTLLSGVYNYNSNTRIMRIFSLTTQVKKYT